MIYERRTRLDSLRRGDRWTTSTRFSRGMIQVSPMLDPSVGPCHSPKLREAINLVRNNGTGQTRDKYYMLTLFTLRRLVTWHVLGPKKGVSNHELANSCPIRSVLTRC